MPTTINTRLRRAFTLTIHSPCFSLVAVAILVHGIFATYEYEHLGTAVGAVDLGIFYQTVQGWAFHADPYVAIKGFSQLGDHFSPIWALLAPLLWLYNSPYTLVLAQVVLLALSGVPVYLAVRRMWGTWRAAGVTAAYLASTGIQHAIAFPVHEVMFATYTTTLHASNSVQLFLSIIEHPHEVVHLLVGSHMKRELWYLLFAPVACLALASPITLLAVPELFARLLSSDSSLWSTSFHYDAPLMPIVFLGAVDAMPRLGKLVALYTDEATTTRTLRWATTGFVAITLAMTMNLWDRLPLGTWLQRPAVYESSAQRNADLSEAVAAVPGGVTVETTNRAAVPLLSRDTVTIVEDRPSGTWAVFDLTALGGRTSADAVPYVATMLREGWRLVRQEGPIVVLHDDLLVPKA